MLAWLALAAAFASAAGPFTIDPPPGWTQVQEPAPAPLLLRLRGPDSSSFLLTRAPDLPLNNRAAVRSYLVQVVAGFDRQAADDYGPPGPLMTARYDNGLTLLYVECAKPGHKKLVLGAVDFGGSLALGTLVSSVPETLMPSLFGALKAPYGPAAGAGSPISADGQLEVSLPQGARTRALTAAERKQGFVLAVEGLGSEVMILKILDDDPAPSKDQPQLVRQTVLAFPGVDPKTLSPIGLIETLPGPDFIYASAAVRDPSGPERFMAGYMPWGYWGYSILAKGAKPVELSRAVFGALALGPSALPKVVASTPPIPVSRPFRWRSRAGVLAAAALALLTVLAFLFSRRGRATPAP